MYAVFSPFWNRTISRHRSIENAVKAEDKFQRMIKRENGESSYVPTSIKRIECGELVGLTEDESAEAAYLRDR